MNRATARRFGTFGGVFTPSILTILGVIMYMRLPMIAGEAGLFGTLGIVLIAHLISITTGLSVSSIATDKKVKEGGTYYIISRSLGLPIGGTLGLALFVGLSFAVSLYLIGFSESFLGYFNLPMDITHIRITGSIILLVVTIITFISTSLAIRTQYLIMTAIGLSLLSILLGRHDMTPASPNFFGHGTGIPLMVLFGIFFPAVTGFEAGVSMSGDLRDPKRSIPLGTITAIAIGLVVYIGLAFFFSYTVDGALLASDPRALFKIARVPELVIAGIWGATLSSALGSILAAPRILQSTAIDKITPRIFARGTGAAREPRNALLLTFLIAEAGILIGELNVIARIVSIFFITTYGFLNLSAAFERMTSADFRPSFKTPAWISIIGSLACFIVMIQLDFLAMIAGVTILGLLFLLLKRRQLVLETGDTWSGVWSTLVRTGLKRLNKSFEHTRNWRPNIILFCGQDNARPHLIELARAFSGRLGMFSAFELVESSEPRLKKDKRYFSAYDKTDKLLIHQHTCRNIFDGMDEIARVYGFSGIEPNTILMGWSRNPRNKERFLRLIRGFEESDFNSIFLNYSPLKKFGGKKTIDVWWSGWGRNLTFSIFLLRHFTSSGEWKDALIRLLIINNVQAHTESLHKMLVQILAHYRINIEIKIINNSIEGLSKPEIISRESAATDLTLIGVPDRQYQHLDQAYDDVTMLSQHIGTFLIVNSSSGFESFDLGLEDKTETDLTGTRVPDTMLPEIQASKYPVIQEDIRKIDTNGLQLLTQFFEKTFVPVFGEIQRLTGELQAALQTAFTQMEKLKDLKDSHRRAKGLIKSSNDFYFRANRIFSELTQKKLEIQKDIMESGIKWYIHRLDENLRDVPQRLHIEYEKADLAIKKNDPSRLKWFKLRRRIMHPFARHTIPGRIHYHEIAAYYLRDNRHSFLASFLEKFQNDLFTLFGENRALITSTDEMMEKLLRKAAKQDEFIQVVQTQQKAIEEKIAALITGIKEHLDEQRYRLLAEFRKNLQLMSHDLGKADINFRIRRKRRKKKYYEELIKQNSGFAETWYEHTLLRINRIHLDVLLQAYKGRIQDKIHELNLRIIQQLDNRYRLELQKIRSKLEAFSGDMDGIASSKTSIRAIEENLTLLRDFDHLGEEILTLTEILPESMVIANEDMTRESDNELPEPLEIPLRKIARFYIEARFIGATHDQLEEMSELLKSPIFMIQDLLSLTRFNLQNIPEDLPDRSQVVSPIITEACQKIRKEEDKILQMREQIMAMVDLSLQEVFGQLSAYKISTTVTDYSRFIRQPQGRFVIRTVDVFFNRISRFLRDISARVLYSRSEGILLARKLIELEPVVVANQEIIGLVESVSPSRKVLEKLPQFYKNLFSGRSSINEDFWINREKDEAMFRTAVARHHAGYRGGILIIGERDSGKTTFCKNMTDKLFKKDKVCHLFPVPNGSSREADFVAELARAVQVGGSVDEIMASFTRGSVLVIHDLELWWERSAQGWDIIRLLIHLIDNFSNQVLFVINMNPHAFDLMNKLVKLQDAFISIIPLRPFDALEIKEMIIRRHRSSGLKFVLHKTEEEGMTEIRMARLFNAYFDFAEGNPGTALKAWLSNIVSVSGNRIFIKTPRLPDIRVLTEMDEDWKLVLIQMILHKRLSFKKMTQLFLSDDLHARSVVGSMSRAGLIEERNENLFIVNTFLEPHIIRTFKREGLL